MNSPESESHRKLSDPTRWVDLHGDVLYRYAHRYVSNATVAEDLVQETFLAALGVQASFAGQSSEQSWFIGILKNKIMDHFRRSAREAHPGRSQTISGDADIDFIQAGPDKGTWHPMRRPARWMVDPNDPSEREEFWVYLQLCLGALDSQHAQLFILREVQEVDYEELCNVLDLSHTNLRVMLCRARKLLRSCLEKRWIQSGRTPGA